MRLTSLTTLLVCLFPFFSHAARADESDRFFPRDPNRVVIGVGVWNITDSTASIKDTDFRLELRLSQIPVWKMHPWLGFETAQFNALWIGGGLESDIDLYKDWLVLTLQTGVGYFNDGDTIPIGWHYTPPEGLEFRHQIELAVRFPEGNRIGVGFTHMSNAGISDNGNPSMNSLMANFSIPLTWGAPVPKP